ncbi:MAG TPA: hypothetical protein VK125_05070 [Bacillota bacterium]|nr:hypothetical protein [Bacillota bacterium]
MPFLPAVCDGCYSLFSSDIYVRSYEVEVFGHEAEPCPNCGSKGHVRSGIYKFINYTLSILTNQDRTMIELTSLHDVMQLAEDGKLLQEHLEMIVIYDLPSFSDILLLLPEDEKDYKLCLSLLIQITASLIEISSQRGNGTKSYEPIIKLYQNIKIKEIIEQIFTNNAGTARRLF